MKKLISVFLIINFTLLFIVNCLPAVAFAEAGSLAIVHPHS